MTNHSAIRYYDRLSKWVANAPRGKKLARLSVLRKHRHNDLREFAARGRVRDVQLDLFASR